MNNKSTNQGRNLNFDPDGANNLESKNIERSFAFKVTPYYSNLINWNDKNDPLRKIIMPSLAELETSSNFDVSNEVLYTVLQGVQHKYKETVLLLVTETCAAYCRYCFRKRFTLSTTKDNHIILENEESEVSAETTLDINKAVEYIFGHSEINNVLLTGGDPLILSEKKIDEILKKLSEIPHVNFIRIGTKVPAFDPEKLTDSYIRTLSKYSIPERGLYLIVQFTHPRELTELAVKKLYELRKNGILLLNQTPLLKDINDDPAVLAELFSKLVTCGVVPYYLFHCRPVRGNREFIMTIQAGLDVVIETKNKLNGLAKLFKYVGSHSTGKIEIIGKRNHKIILKYHQSVKLDDHERVLELSENAYWFDDLTEV